MSNPSILIFSGRLLPSSETFIKAQADGLQNFVPYFAGARLIDGLPLPEDRTVVVNSGGYPGKIREFLFKQTGYAPRFYQQLHQLEPFLIHAHFGVCGTLALPIARALKIPLIVTFHGFDASMTDEYARRDSLSTRVYLQRREQLKQETHLFIAVSHFIKSRLVQQGFPEDRIKVHHIGIDTEKFRSDSSVVRQPKVLFVGRLVAKKGCHDLVKAMAKVQAAIPDVELIVIGDGPLRLELEALAAKSLKHYNFLGLQTPEEVKRWMNQAQVLVAPSITTKDGDTEGLPMVILEAQSMGLPVISTVHAGIPEAIIDGDTGFLVPEGDMNEIAQRIKLLFCNPNYWSDLSYKGREFVCSNFDLQKQTKKLEAIYQKVSSD